MFLGKIDRSIDADLFALLESSIMNTRSDQHNMDTLVRDIYAINKPMHDLRYKSFNKRLHNKCLLFHGLHQTNLAATLKDGIKYPHE